MIWKVKTFALAGVLGLMGLLTPTPAKADPCSFDASQTCTTFDVSGTFADGSALSGTFTVDVSAGGVLTADLAWSDVPGASFIYTSGGPGDEDNYFNLLVSNTTSESGLGPTQIDLIFPISSFIGYSGGPLCSTTDPCVYAPNGDVFYTNATDAADPNLTSGSVTPEGVAAPEPSSLLLLGIGLFGLGGMAYWRKNAQSAAF